MKRKQPRRVVSTCVCYSSCLLCNHFWNAILNWGMQEWHPALQTFGVKESRTGDRGTAGWTWGAWGCGLLLEQEGVLQVVENLLWCVPERDLSTLAAPFAGMPGAKFVTFCPSEPRAPLMAEHIRLSFWQGADNPSLAEAQSQGSMGPLGSIAATAGLKAVESQMASAFAFLSVDILWVFLGALDHFRFPRTHTLCLLLLGNLLECCMKWDDLETMQSHSSFPSLSSMKQPVSSISINHS